MTDFEFKILSEINVESRDNGREFTVRDRHEAIAGILSGGEYRLIEEAPLFYMYAKKELCELDERIIVISTHIDCVPQITKFFTEETSDEEIAGTFDNSITNAAAVLLMLEDGLSKNVVIAFTGDEERGSKGAMAVCSYLRGAGKKFFAVSLDVTYTGYDEGYNFTVENDAWDNDKYGEYIAAAADRSGGKWGYVPYDSEELSECFGEDKTFFEADGTPMEADPDEACAYYECGEDGFSLCIPVCGDMHANCGVRTYKNSFDHYKNALKSIANTLSRMKI